MFGCQQVLIHPSDEIKSILEFICEESTKLSNCGKYYARQLFFKTGKLPGKFDLHREMSKNPHFQALHSQVAQQCLTTVAESFQSFIGLLKALKKGTVDQKPKLPGYRRGGLSLVTFPGQAIKLKSEGLRFPLGSKVKAWFGLDAFYLPMPSNLEHEAIREYRILPRHGCFYLELVYKVPDQKVDVDPDKALMIDHGMDNWLTCVSNVGDGMFSKRCFGGNLPPETPLGSFPRKHFRSFIVDGKHLKSINQGYNKRVAFLMEGQANGYWSKRLARLTEKRNRVMRDAINKAARRVITHCIENRIGTVIFGWNKGQKDSADMGSKTNQKFVQIPTCRLKDRVKQLCELYGIRFVETEESYSSKASFIDLDELPTFGEKPEGWKARGKRVKRGLYRTLQGWLINADCNGAANIGRKVAMMLGLDLSGISRGDLSAPLRLKLWSYESPSL